MGLKMNTVVKNWQIVAILGHEGELGRVLYGTVVHDSSCRFNAGDYVTTSSIEKFNSDGTLLQTKSGSTYQLLGGGCMSEIKFEDFEMLRAGLSPQEIKFVREYNISYFH